MKPKLTIDNFAGMGDNGIVWAESCAPKKIGGQSVMNGSGDSYTRIDSDDTRFTNLADINAIHGIAVGDDNKYMVGLGSSRIFMWNTLSTPSTSQGEIHDSGQTATSYPDILVTTQGDILYTNADTLGIGWYGTCKTGSSTTQIVDNENRDMKDDLGLAVGDKIYNIENKEEYEIASFDTTTSANDTMVFTAGTENSIGDEFHAFVDDAFDYFGSITSDQFYGQEASTISWHRTMVLFGDYYYLLNGNYLGQMPVDQTTWESTKTDVLIEDFKQLPYNTQGMCMDINADKLLLGGEYKNRGKLMLWDGYSDFWLNEIVLDELPSSIKAYKTGWVVLVRNTIYFTDGYQLQKISSYPIGRGYDYTIATNPNSMCVLDDKILISCNSINYQRLRVGTLVYYPESGWNYIPMIGSGNYYGYRGKSLAIYPMTNENRVYVSQQITDGKYSINAIDLDQGAERTSFIYYVKLPEPMKISMIGLNLSPQVDANFNQDATVDVTVNYGDGKDALHKYAQISSASTTTKLYNTQGASTSGTLGGKVLILDEDSSGEMTYITAMANAGESTEELTVSPALSTAITDTQNIILQNLKLSKKETVTNNKIPNELNFEIDNFYSDKLFIEVVMEGNYPLDVNSINVY